MKIQLLKGDITRINAEAIVNAANASLLGGGGVDGAIHSAGGPEILQACQIIKKEQGICKTGEAVITTAGNLPAKKVIHTVGPIFNDDADLENQKQLLACCYLNSLKLAEAHHLKSIAFPNISTGVYGFPKELAAKVATESVLNYKSAIIENVIFVCFDDENYQIYQEILKQELAMRTLAIGDIHGGLKALKQLFSSAEITANDQLIFVGDYVDGWSESAEVIQYLMALSKTHKCIFIKGNHDVWCETWLRTNKAEKVWVEHGGKSTIESYARFSTEEKQKHQEFFEHMKLYHLDNQNRLFIHAGFTSMHGVEQEPYQNTFYFDRTLWEMALTMDKQIDENSELYPKRLKHYDEIYIGHTPTINFNSEKPMNAINVWNVDTGAAFYGKLSAVDIDSKEVFQSETLMELYPDEKGRNERSLNQILGNSKS